MRSFPLGLVESGTDLHIAHHSKVFWWVQPLSGAPQEMPWPFLGNQYLREIYQSWLTYSSGNVYGIEEKSGKCMELKKIGGKLQKWESSV